jgi:hypothetical protein
MAKRWHLIKNWFDSKFTLKGFAAFLFLLICAIPDWESRGEFWKVRVHSIGHFFLTPLGRVTLICIGVLVIWLDHRDVLKRRKDQVPASAVTEHSSAARHQPAPNIRWGTPKCATYYWNSRKAMWKSEWTTLDSHGSALLVIPVRNAPSSLEDIPPLTNAVAEVSFHSLTGDNIGRSSPSVWIGELFSQIIIQPSETKEVVIARKERNDEVTIVSNPLKTVGSPSMEHTGLAGVPEAHLKCDKFPLNEQGWLRIDLVDQMKGRIVSHAEFNWKRDAKSILYLSPRLPSLT